MCCRYDFTLDDLVSQKTYSPTCIACRWFRAGKRNQLGLAFAIEDWLVRRNAAESLARLGAKEAIQSLLPLLEDENAMVQETVEGVLASFGWKAEQ